jgi:hypothetical protein
MAEPPRRFPSPWHAEPMPGGYVVRDANGQALAYLYSRDNEAEARVKDGPNGEVADQDARAETLEKLIEEYSAFQRSRPDLPQGSLCDLSQDELELARRGIPAS